MNKHRSKPELILEILDLMERLGKDRDWLNEQSKKKPLNVPNRSHDMSVSAILQSCPLSFLSTIHINLNKGGLRINEALSTVRAYHWFFTDIVASANPNLTTEEQARRIVVLNQLTSNAKAFRDRDRKNTLSLPTGDGMAIGFANNPEEPLLLAIEVNRALNNYNKDRKDKEVSIRIGLDSGPVFLIRDINGQVNAWGQGLIMARRIMDLGGDMHILASHNFVNQIERLRAVYRGKIELVGYYSVKHDERILVYNIFGDGFGNKRRPNIPDVIEEAEQMKDAVATKRFLFSSIEISLDLTDVNTMLMHHKIIWHVINITKQPVERIFYFIGGDCPRSFQDLHVSVTDEKKRPLQIMEISQNKPDHKEFWVKANKPINPFEKGRSLTWDYDWEEPERQFLYQFASQCNKFKIQITVPSSFAVNQKVVKVDLATGDRMLAKTPATVKYFPERTTISWSSENLQAYDAYRFDW